MPYKQVYNNLLVYKTPNKKKCYLKYLTVISLVRTTPIQLQSINLFFRHISLSLIIISLLLFVV